MHTHAEALKILGCSKSTLHKYVKEGRLKRIKRGRHTYYDEHEVAALVPVVEEGKKKGHKPIKEKEPIPLPDNVASEVGNIAANSKLDAVGMQYLSEAAKWLEESGLFEECDRHVLLDYAIHAMLWNRYIVLAMENDGVTMNASGSMQVHPYHRIAMDHHRQMMACADRLGLNPKARQKLKPKEIDDIDEMEALLG
ncbi:P27 family phage terminase small subunit [Hydrogenimonas sp.]